MGWECWSLCDHGMRGEGEVRGSVDYCVMMR